MVYKWLHASGEKLKQKREEKKLVFYMEMR